MNASLVIDALGGTVAVAKLFRIKPPSVSEWRKNGIPAARLQLIEHMYPAALSATDSVPTYDAGEPAARAAA